MFIDEIDKLKRPGQQGSSGEIVQHALLKIMEGAQVKLANGRYMDTATSCSSAAARSSGSTRSCSQTHGYGFIATSRGRQPADPRPAQHAREADRSLHVTG